jgi:Zn-dependent M16 (insulinase) family peptidase
VHTTPTERRYLLGVTDEERQARRDQVLATTTRDFKAFGEVLAAAAGPAARVVAVTSPDKAEAVLAERPGFWEVKKVL